MKTVGIFEAKTKLSEICETVAQTSVPVMITRRGAPLVYIEPIREEPQRLTVRERRAAYMAKHGQEEVDDDVDFEPAPRSKENTAFRIEE